MDDHELAQKILSFCKANVSDSSLSDFSEDVVGTFLAMGSKTPDNLNCAKYIEYGIVKEREFGPATVYGLKVKGKRLLLSDVMNVIENLYMPDEIKETFPDITNSEWDAITRMITMILISLECKKP